LLLLLEIVAERAHAGNENAARQREPRAENEDEQQRVVIHR
jgi:hypothetical protein